MNLPKNSRLNPIFKIQDEYFLRLHFFDTGTLNGTYILPIKTLTQSVVCMPLVQKHFKIILELIFL